MLGRFGCGGCGGSGKGGWWGGGVLLGGLEEVLVRGDRRDGWRERWIDYGFDDVDYGVGVFFVGVIGVVVIVGIRVVVGVCFWCFVNVFWVLVKFVMIGVIKFVGGGVIWIRNIVVVCGWVGVFLGDLVLFVLGVIYS